MRNPLVFIVLVLVLTIGGCQLRPSNVLSRSKMVKVTRSVLLVDAYLNNNYLSDSASRLLYESVFAEYNITREDYDSSLIWYGKNTEKFASVYEEIERNLKEDIHRLDSIYNDSVRETRVRYTPAADLWEENKHRILISGSDYYFTISRLLYEPDSIAGKDTIRWQMAFLPQLYKGETIILSMYIKDGAKKNIFYKAADTITRARQHHLYEIILPDTLPSAYSMDFRLSYFRNDSVRRTLPLLIDKITLKRLQYVTPVAEEPKDSIPNDTPTDSIETPIPTDSLSTADEGMTLETPTDSIS